MRILYLLILIFYTQIAFGQVLQHSVERGFYNVPFAVALSSDITNATIKFTIDGSEPSPTNGTVYTAAINIATTTPLRSIAYNSTDTTKVQTHTYIFPNDVLSSSVMNQTLVNDPVYGNQMINALTSIPSISVTSGELTVPLDTCYVPKQASVEYILADGSEGFQIDCGIENFGGTWSINAFDKKNFRLKFKSEFGPKKLKYPLFDGYDRGIAAADEFDQLNLRMGSHDMVQRGFYMSNRFTDDLMLDMGHAVPHGRFVHLYFNGIYWGQYHLRERFNSDFFASYHGGNDNDYDAINGNLNAGGWNSGEVYDGDSLAWTSIKDSLQGYNNLKNMVDLDNYIDYMITYLLGYSENEYRCGGSSDFSNKFTFFLNDADGWLRAPVAIVMPNFYPVETALRGPGDILENLLAEAHPDFMMHFADNICKHLTCEGGVLTPAENTKRLNERCEEVELSMLTECARWEERTYESWLQSWDTTTNYILPAKTQAAIDGFINEGLYPTLNAVDYSLTGGLVNAGTSIQLTNSNSGGTIYYTLDGSDPRLSGGALNPNAIIYNGNIQINSNAILTARILNAGIWSPVCPQEYFVQQNYSDIVINEIHYNPTDSIFPNDTIDGDQYEFIEIKNKGNTIVDLSRVNFAYAINFTFPFGSILQPGEFYVLAEDSLHFLERYGFAPDARYKGKLKNSGEKVSLLDPFGGIIDEVIYDDVAPWSITADGTGPSLALLPNITDNSLASSWAEQATIYTPKAENDFCFTISSTILSINVDCFGANNGSIVYLPSGGTAPYTYSWSNGQSTQNLTNLSGGTYTLTLTDNYNCTQFETVNISEPSQALSLSSIWVDESIDGANDGVINLAVVGGTSPYTYQWNSGQTFQDINNLADGTYTVTVTDNNGCTETHTVTIAPGIMPCTVPTNIVASNIQNTSATLSWSNNSNASVYEVSYKAINNPVWTTFNSNFNFAILNNLSSCETYEVRIKSTCSNAQISQYSNIYSFQTAGCVLPCATINGLFSQNVTSASAFLVWDIVPNATYTMYYKAAGNANWFSYPTQFPIAILFTLPACTDFEWYVEVNCPNGQISTPSPIANFTTIGANCKTNSNFDNISKLNLYPNPSNDYIIIEHPEIVTTVQLFNTQGQFIKSYLVNDKNVKIDIEFLSLGTYYVKCQSSKTNETIVFVKK